jgi:TfoX/Sxy family transcriptional regulator of competence genes
MPYDEATDDRLKNIVLKWKNVESKKMFGGVCYLLNGNMLCGVYKEFLILRLGEKGAAEALKAEFAAPFDITGKPMKGWVMINKGGFKTDDILLEWLNEAKEFVERLPSK